MSLVTHADFTSAKVEPLPVAASHFTSAMSLAATGVNVVTTDGAAGRFGLTVSAVTSVSAAPPMVLACVNRKSPLVEALTRNGVFCVNVLAANQSHVSDTFAGRGHATAAYDFACAEWIEAVTGAPVVGGANAWFDCALGAAHDAGTHRIFIGRVLAAGTGADAADPLVYAARGYRRLSDLQ